MKAPILCVEMMPLLPGNKYSVLREEASVLFFLSFSFFPCLLKEILFLIVCSGVCVCARVCTHRDQKRLLDPLELELKAVVSSQK